MYRKLICVVSFILLLFLVSTASAELVAHWTFDEGSGNTVADSSGNGYHGTLFDDYVWIDGMYGSALYVEDGGYVAIQELHYEGSGFPEVSVCAWIRTSSSGNQFIVSFDRNEYYRLEINGSGGGPGQVGWDVRTDSGQLDYGSETRVDDGQWHHVCGVFDNGEATIYIDGDPEPSASSGSTYGRGNLRYGFIGKNSEATGFHDPVPGGNPIDGDIDDVRIYDHALTPEEIRELAAQPQSYKPVPAPGALYESTWANLEWRPGKYAVSHDLYFSDSFDDVNDRAAEAFRGNQATTTLIVGFPGYAFPDGLAPGTTYYWRVDDVTADGTTIRGFVWSFWIPPVTAYEPIPGDGEPAVRNDPNLSWSLGMNTIMNGVYFGTDRDEVANGVGAPPNLMPTYDPGPLENSTTYYWRVDTFDGSEWITGPVWTFTTRPEIPLTTDPNLVAFWKFDEGAGSNLLDWSGRGNNGKLFGPEWISPDWAYDGDNALTFPGNSYVAIDGINYSGGGRREVTVCAWVRTDNPDDQYILSFDRNEYYRLQINGEVAGPGQVGWHVMTINSGVEQQVDYGSVTRVDDALWHHVTGVFDHGTSTIFIDGIPEPSAFGGPTYGIGDLVRYGFLGANSEATEYNGERGAGTGITGDLAEVRIYDKALTQDEILQVMRGDPSMAWDLRPTNGRIVEIDDVDTVSWRPGDGATQHDVYFGPDADAVANADASDASGVYRGRQSSTVYRPTEGFDWGQSYYWRIDEVGSGGNLTEGRVRAVNVANYITVEDFEDYNDYPPDEIWSTWIDGYNIPTNGALVGHPEPIDITAGEHYIETGTVQSGRQSMPFYFDTEFKSSEATRTFASPSNWTRHGVEELTLWYFGDPCNVVPEQMYLAVTGGATGVIYNSDPNLLADTWIEWIIPLESLADQGVNLASVTGISLGFGTRGDTSTPGGTGLVFFDTIRLRRTPVITLAPADTFEATGDNGTVVSINGVGVDALVLGETTFAGEPKHGNFPPPDADNFDLSVGASADDQAYVQTLFTVPVSAVFIVEKGGNDSGYVQALNLNGNPIGEKIPFSPADFMDTGLTGVQGQAVTVAVVTADSPIYGIRFLPPDDGTLGFDPTSVSGVPAP
jgi:hypothetical protein